MQTETRGLIFPVTQWRILEISQLFLRSFPYKSIICLDLLLAIFQKSITAWMPWWFTEFFLNISHRVCIFPSCWANGITASSYHPLTECKTFCFQSYLFASLCAHGGSPPYRALFPISVEDSSTREQVENSSSLTPLYRPHSRQVQVIHHIPHTVASGRLAFHSNAFLLMLLLFSLLVSLQGWFHSS